MKKIVIISNIVISAAATACAQDEQESQCNIPKAWEEYGKAGRQIPE